MANVVKLKRGSGSDPSASDMVVGEPVIRTDTAELFFKKDDGSVAKVSGGGGGPDFKYLALRNAANNGAASYPNADFTLVTSGTTNAITPAAANTLLVSVNGVIQKPNTGTSTPSSGFALNGSTIKFGGNISAAPDFILYQESGGIGEPSDETVGEDKLKVSNSPVNGYFLSAQSGNTGGLTWAAPVATSCTGNSATATALATARAINGVNFDGTAAITVTAAAGTLSGNTLNSSVVTSSLTSLGDLAGLTVNGDMSLTGANYNVLWDKSDNALEFADNAKAVFGTGSDLKIYHDGSHSHLNNVTGNLLIGVEGEFQVLNRQENEFRIRAHNNGGVDLYYDHTKRFETSPTGATVTGNLTTTGHVHIPDNFRLKVGNATNGDLILIHDGTDSIIDNASGNLFIRSDSLHLQSTAGENMVVGEANGAVEIYHNNSKKAETVSTGFKVGNQLSIGEAVINLEKSGTHHHRIVGNDTGGDLGFQQSSDNGSNTNFTTYLRINDGGNISLPVDSQVLNLGASQDMQLYHNGTDSYILNATNNLRIGNYNNNNLKFFTSNSTRWEINGSGHFLPDSNNSFDIGSTSKRVRNIYTNDLNLSNEGGANDVDMTWGSYTIQEGHNDLFLINKRTGKKYKFNLTEVS